jgi:hypothetical protein
MVFRLQRILGGFGVGVAVMSKSELLYAIRTRAATMNQQF